MAKLETHFQQIPLDAVKKIISGERRDGAAEEGLPALNRKWRDPSMDRDDAGGTNGGPMNCLMETSEFEISKSERHVHDREWKYPEWQTPLQDLLLEFDREKLLAKIQQVEALIFDRLQKLEQGLHARAEKQAIRDALVVLRIVKRDKLGFPEWE